MDRKWETIHKVLDGDATDEERTLVATWMEADPELHREVKGMMLAADLLKQDGRLQAPPLFSQNVLRRLPQPGPALGQRIREFLFGTRVLQWNMAAAIAAAAILTISSVLFLHGYGRPGAPVIAQRAERELVIVRLQFNAPHAQQVAVAGNFNRWNAGANVMQQRGGIWTIDIPLQPGEYTYMFVVDGSAWVPDPKAESSQDDGFGRKNSVLRIGI